MFAIVAVHAQPVDPSHFDDYYPRVHIPLAEALPGNVGVRYGHVDPDPDQAGAPYVICHVLFPDRAAYEAAASSPEMEAAIADVPRFSTGGVRLYTVDFDNYPPVGHT